jgi:hypothetical protein
VVSKRRRRDTDAHPEIESNSSFPSDDEGREEKAKEEVAAVLRQLPHSPRRSGRQEGKGRSARTVARTERKRNVHGGRKAGRVEVDATK